MNAVIYDNHCRVVATLNGLPNKLHQAAEDFNCALQEAVLDERGFSAVYGGNQVMPQPCELHRVVFGGRYAIDVDRIDLLLRYSKEWCLAGGYLYDAKKRSS